MEIGGKGYNAAPTFSQIKAAMELIPDCNEMDVAELMELGLINQAEYEDLMSVIHGKNDDFKTAPYNNFGYNGQPGPVMPSQIVASNKSRLKKMAEGGYNVTVESESKPMYYLELETAEGRYTSIFDIKGVSPAQINSQLTSKFSGLNDGVNVYFLDKQDADQAAAWLMQQINGQA